MGVIVSSCCSLYKSELKILLELTLKRMKVKVSCGGGCVGANLAYATHLVIMSLPGLDMNMDMVLSRWAQTPTSLLVD